jgi:hypothetical protein
LELKLLEIIERPKRHGPSDATAGQKTSEEPVKITESKQEKSEVNDSKKKIQKAKLN